MIQYADYKAPQSGALAAVGGKLIPLSDAVPILAKNAMVLAVGGVGKSTAA